MNRLILQIIAGILGIFLATKFVPGVSLEVIPGQSSLFGIEFTASWQILLLIGSVLGLINFFIKPVLKMITLPLRILTFGLFSLVINMVMVWTVDILFPELVIQGIIPLFWLSIIIWGVSLLLGLYQPRKRVVVEE
ncbi:MAG: phage holin family protein [Candidatus Nealsonbacteria bacterium]|nr:MAG: phage holin family protein [Candidatus Nealsonbacteria bacterium]